eukprot:TRINITY_DN4746_c0_g1_i1.p1 TRINITY_DN4746_c0_g1~~TRINITY_DN4746_c0_g1_i1.p1  ORF type:complete len:130 (-),score=39.83 TRINITY_DN4746_c0_g1_i1:1-390(-)
MRMDVDRGLIAILDVECLRMKITPAQLRKLQQRAQGVSPGLARQLTYSMDRLEAAKKGLARVSKHLKSLYGQKKELKQKLEKSDNGDIKSTLEGVEKKIETLERHKKIHQTNKENHQRKLEEVQSKMNE